MIPSILMRSVHPRRDELDDTHVCSYFLVRPQVHEWSCWTIGSNTEQSEIGSSDHMPEIIAVASGIKTN
jgi:hypothetical protein